MLQWGRPDDEVAALVVDDRCGWSTERVEAAHVKVWTLLAVDRHHVAPVIRTGAHVVASIERIPSGPYSAIRSSISAGRTLPVPRPHSHVLVTTPRNGPRSAP